MKHLYLVLGFALIAGAVSAQAPQNDLELVDSALAQVGLTMRDVRFDADEVATYKGDLWQLSTFTLYHHNPFKLPQHANLDLETYRTAANNITSLMAKASGLIDHPIRRSLVGDPLEPYLVAHDTVPLQSMTRSRNYLAGPEFDRLKDGIDLIYRMVDDDKFLFKHGLDEVNKAKYREKLFDYFINDKEENQDIIYEIDRKIDYDYMLAGAQDFAEAVRRLCLAADSLQFPKEKRELKTNRGLIVVGSSGDDVYQYFVPPLMIIDGGGNDRYEFGGYPEDYPLSIIIDFKGDDQYLSPDTTKPGLGGAVLGMSILVDLAGNDRYVGANVTQGAGIFGVGLVYDKNGDDVYTGRRLTQGAATFGVGILSDSTGADSLFCLDQSQGYGYTKGCGLLINFEGSDRYVADDANIILPSAQTKEHNTSMAQGVGCGRRADISDGHSWAGGVGVLCDLAGDDIYSAGLFAQGCAYWHALGMLLEGGGNDSYSGVWYVQGSGAHFGVGYLDDFGGNDKYNATLNMAIGAGHDFTIGYLNERSGNDVYTAPNLSLGGGNDAGIGIFHDHAGDDTYNTKGGTTLGRANPSSIGARRFLRCFGIFVDGGGQDTYIENWAGNGSRWIGPATDPANPSPYTIGVGIDRQ